MAEPDNLMAALSKAQGELQNPPKRHTNPHFKNKYADLSDGLDAVRPVLSKHGLAITQLTEMQGDVLVLKTMLLHTSGETLSSYWPISKIGAQQAMGAGMTYARRYTLFALVGISGESDTDGEGSLDASPPPPNKATGGWTTAQYVERAIAYLGDIESVDRLNTWWKTEGKNRALHFADKSDPLYIRLFDAVQTRGAALKAEDNQPEAAA